MKRVLTILTTAVVALTITACSQPEGKPSDTSQSAAASTEATDPPNSDKTTPECLAAMHTATEVWAPAVDPNESDPPNEVLDEAEKNTLIVCETPEIWWEAYRITPYDGADSVELFTKEVIFTVSCAQYAETPVCVGAAKQGLIKDS